MSKNKPSTSKLRLVIEDIHASMPSKPGGSGVCGPVARVAQSFSAGIEYWHCKVCLTPFIPENTHLP